MTKKLLVVFASGLILAAALFGVAWAIGGPAFVGDLRRHHDWTFTFDDDDDGPRDRRPQAVRTLAFDPASRLTIEAPVMLRYQRGPQAKMTVSGPRWLVAAVQLEHGRLSLARSFNIKGHSGLRVTVTAPQMPPLAITGAADVELAGLDQPQLDIDLRGAGAIEGRGQAARVDVSNSGAGSVDLSAVRAQDARVRLAGLGEIEVDAGGKVDVEISGAGRVALHRKPAQLTSRITGLGTIDQQY